MRILVLGISGVAGRAIAAELADGGHEVAGTGRRRERFPSALAERGVTWIRSDRHSPDDLDVVLGSGADVVIDCLCYCAEHARQLLSRSAAFGSAVVISSKAVYVDDQGRHANSDAPPVFDGPVSEVQPVLEPDFSGAFASREGYGPNKVAAEIVLGESGVPVSILRASRIHGPGADPPREWFVLRRLLDGRDRIPVGHRGLSGNHPTAAANLARLVARCVQSPGARVLNAADPGCPMALDVVGAVAAAAGRPVEVVGLDEDAPAELGWTPWGSWPAVFLDTSASRSLGYEPAGTYAETVRATVDALLRLDARERAGLSESAFFAGRFDYGADDAALRYQDRR